MSTASTLPVAVVVHDADWAGAVSDELRRAGLQVEEIEARPLTEDVHTSWGHLSPGAFAGVVDRGAPTMAGIGLAARVRAPLVLLEIAEAVVAALGSRVRRVPLLAVELEGVRLLSSIPVDVRAPAPVPVDCCADHEHRRVLLEHFGVRADPRAGLDVEGIRCLRLRAAGRLRVLVEGVELHAERLMVERHPHELLLADGVGGDDQHERARTR